VVRRYLTAQAARKGMADAGGALDNME